MRNILAVVFSVMLGATFVGPVVMLPEVAHAEPTVEDILAGIDKNMVYETRTSRTKMTVVNARRTLEYEMQTMGRGQDDSAVEYLAPAREKGTRMLRLGDDLWTYLPSIDRTQKISGHMLRQGMMGSDVSYEDMMSSTKLREQYTATVVGSETVNERTCWKLELIANDTTVTYPKRIQWVDQELYIPIKQELYAVSGMLLKTWEMSDIQDFDGRKFPTKMVISDKLKAGSSTTLNFSEMSFGVALEGEVFSMRWLERK